MELCRYLDHAVLKPGMTRQQATEEIRLGVECNAATVCVRPCDIRLAQEICRGTETKVICVLDFPHGCSGAETKEALAGIYADMGVFEIDMVMNYGFARSGLWDAVYDEVKRVVDVAHSKGVGVKVIFETSELTCDEIRKGTEICAEAGADFVKTSTGFSSHGATVEAVKAMLDAAKGRIKVKASGGIRTVEQAESYIRMGVERLGVGSTTTPVLCGKA